MERSLDSSSVLWCYLLGALLFHPQKKVHCYLCVAYKSYIVFCNLNLSYLAGRNLCFHNNPINLCTYLFCSGEDVAIQYTILYKMLLLSCIYCYSAIGHQVEPCKFAASYLLMFLRSKWKRSDTYLVGIGGTEASKISDRKYKWQQLTQIIVNCLEKIMERMINLMRRPAIVNTEYLLSLLARVFKYPQPVLVVHHRANLKLYCIANWGVNYLLYIIVSVL